MSSPFLRWVSPRQARALPDPQLTPSAKASVAVSSELSTTVFAGESEAWRDYLETPWEQRCDPDGLRIEVRRHTWDERLQFEPIGGPHVKDWCRWLNGAVVTVNEKMSAQPAVAALLQRLLFGNAERQSKVVEMRTAKDLPGPATREIRFDDAFDPVVTRILLSTQLVQSVQNERIQKEKPTHLENLGLVWPVLRRIFLCLGYPNYPRDRFTERIEITTLWVIVNLYLLYDGKEGGKLVPNPCGELFERYTAKRDGESVQHIQRRNPFFRLLNDLSFLLNARQLATGEASARIFVRDYLDSRYLRLSIAGLMPDVPDWMQAMDFEWKGKKKVITPAPKAGQFGILDDEDLVAWKKVREPLADNHYHLVRQLGIGQFGRVYEAINATNASIPERVAIKVDRIRKGMKKEAIEAAETIMQTAGGLSSSPHVIRVFDAGKLPKVRATFHVLQLVDGDTLDNLLGITGSEHSSILRPLQPRPDEEAARHEFLSALDLSDGEAWRRARQAPPFSSPPDLVDLLDLLVSKTLWVEEVHRLGFAINDLKNGNVMISRRGQFKAIDLDAYSQTFTAYDRLPDYFFLAASTVQMITARHGQLGSGELKSLFGETKRLREFLLKYWNFSELPAIQQDRLSREDVVDFICDFTATARTGGYAHEPGAFTEAIDRLISLKRKLGYNEMVME